MPRVPTYDGLQVQQNTLPNARITASPNPNNYSAQQAIESGRTMQKIGGAVGQAVTKFQEQANQLRGDEALNRFKEEALRLTYDKDDGYTNLKGAAALERPDGKPLASEYSDKLFKYASEIEQGLGNDAQRAAFRAGARNILTNFHGQILNHEAKEYETYALSVSEGVQATARREIALSWDNPDATDNAVKRIRAHAYQQGKLLGKSAEWQEAHVRQAVSDAHSLAIEEALKHDHALYADSYLDKYSNQMEAKDIVDARNKIMGMVDLQVGENIGAEVFALNAGRLAPSDFGRLANLVEGEESNHRDYDDKGNILEGPETKYGTAKGRMQVLDGTKKDPGFGVKPAQDDTPEELARVGRDYLAAMIRRYKGDLAKTLAAYNWGPGNLDAAIKKNGSQWLDSAPPETQKYVARIMERYGAGLGKDHKPSLLELKQQLRTQPELVRNPERLKYAEARLERDFKDFEAAEKQAEEQALDTAYKELTANGGDFAALPADIRMAIPGDKLSSVRTFADKERNRHHNPEAWARILSLPKDELAKMTPLDFYERYHHVLDDTHMAKGYALISDAQGSPDAKHLEVISTANRIKQAAMSMGTIPADGSKPSEGQNKAFALFAQTVDERVRQFEEVDLEGKRKANSEELQKILDGIALDTVNVSGYVWDDKNVPVAQLSPGELEDAYVVVDDAKVKISSIPNTYREMIVEALRAAGLPVSEKAIARKWVDLGKPTK